MSQFFNEVTFEKTSIFDMFQSVNTRVVQFEQFRKIRLILYRYLQNDLILAFPKIALTVNAQEKNTSHFTV